jgi:hypothetical protein
MTAEEQKFETMHMIHDAHRKEISYHRTVMYQVFQGITGLLVSIGAAIIAIGHEQWEGYGKKGPIIVTVGAITICVLGLWLVRHSAITMDRNARVVVKTDTFFHLFEADYFLPSDPKAPVPEGFYPESWKNWGNIDQSAGDHRIVYSTIITLFTVIIVIFAWTYSGIW